MIWIWRESWFAFDRIRRIRLLETTLDNCAVTAIFLVHCYSYVGPFSTFPVKSKYLALESRLKLGLILKASFRMLEAETVRVEGWFNLHSTIHSNPRKCMLDCTQRSIILFMERSNVCYLMMWNVDKHVIPYFIITLAPAATWWSQSHNLNRRLK